MWGIAKSYVILIWNRLYHNHRDTSHYKFLKKSVSPQPGQIAPILTNTQVKLITKNCFKNICQKCNFKSHQDNLCKGATAFSHLYSSHHQTAHPHHAHLRPYPPIFHTHFKRDLLSLRQFFVVKGLFFKDIFWYAVNGFQQKRNSKNWRSLLLPRPFPFGGTLVFGRYDHLYYIESSKL